jgi:hypothetical protein
MDCGLSPYNQGLEVWTCQTRQQGRLLLWREVLIINMQDLRDDSNTIGSFCLAEWLNEEARHFGLLSLLEIEAELHPALSMSWIN